MAHAGEEENSSGEKFRKSLKFFEFFLKDKTHEDVEKIPKKSIFRPEECKEGFPDFRSADETTSVELRLEDGSLFAHKEILAAWSPVFRVMFHGGFRESRDRVVEFAGKNIAQMGELLRCLYPPIKPIDESNVYEVLPLAEEYAIDDALRRCENVLLREKVSVELLYVAHSYGLRALTERCREELGRKSLQQLDADPYFRRLDDKLRQDVLRGCVRELERRLGNVRASNRRLVASFSELNSGNSYCQLCRSRAVCEDCSSCLQLFRQRVKLKCKEVTGQMRAINDY